MAVNKKEGKKIFRFKEENYSVYDLINFYSDSRLKDFKEGEVTPDIAHEIGVKFAEEYLATRQ